MMSFSGARGRRQVVSGGLACLVGIGLPALATYAASTRSISVLAPRLHPRA